MPLERGARRDDSRIGVDRRVERWKRPLDLLLVLLGLPVVVVVVLLVALGVRLDSPGPVLLEQVRVGRGGRTFRLYKFRTLRADFRAEEDLAFLRAYIRGEVPAAMVGDGVGLYKPDHAGAVTPLGRVLRRTGLDELPQLWNVVRGDMSLVGPRPHVPAEVAEYRAWHRARHVVRPGITGLAQVRGRSSIPFDRMVEWDLAYIERASPWLDLRILAASLVSVVLRRDGG